MGLFDYFARRRERESAVGGLSTSADLSQRASPTPAGEGASQRTATAAAGADLAQLARIGTLIAQAAKEGGIQVHQGSPEEIELREIRIEPPGSHHQA